MLSALIKTLLPLIQSLGEEFERNIPEFKERIREVLSKHRQQMATDPNYPMMLLFVASVIIKKYIRKQSQAAMAIFLLEQAIRQAISRLDWNRGDYWDENDGYSDY